MANTAQSAAAGGGNPWLTAALLGGSMLSAYNQPDPAEQLPGNLVMTDPRQWQLYGDMVNAYQSGSGDYGYGSMMRSGESQLAQALADRGISQDSGVYTSALTDLIAQAQAADAANRYQYGVSLLNSPPSTAVITGENQIPGAAEMGSGGTLSSTWESDMKGRGLVGNHQSFEDWVRNRQKYGY